MRFWHYLEISLLTLQPKWEDNREEEQRHGLCYRYSYRWWCYADCTGTTMWWILRLTAWNVLTMFITLGISLLPTMVYTIVWYVISSVWTTHWLRYWWYRFLPVCSSWLGAATLDALSIAPATKTLLVHLHSFCFHNYQIITHLLI